MASGLKLSIKGQIKCFMTWTKSKSPKPFSSGILTLNPLAWSFPTSSTKPVPGKKWSSYRCRLQKKTDLSLAKMSFVPFPWCTSQSRMAILFKPCSFWACRAATATLLNMQKPQAFSSLAWWPGGRMAAKPQLQLESVESVEAIQWSTRANKQPADSEAHKGVWSFAYVSGPKGLNSPWVFKVINEKVTTKAGSWKKWKKMKIKTSKKKTMAQK